jgi:ribosomal protein S28E/S33
MPKPTRIVASIAGPDGRIILDNIRGVVIYANDVVEITLTEKEVEKLRRKA